MRLCSESLPITATVTCSTQRENRPADADARLLADLHTRGAVPFATSTALQPLQSRGFVEEVGDDVDLASVRLRYERNPLENLRRVVFEYTTLCNLDCLHCRNGSIKAQATADPKALRRVVDAVLPIGLDRFDFIGGEVMLYGKGWLDLVAYIRAQGGTHTSVLTSGWFLGETGFFAADRHYADDRAYLDDLRMSGLTHVAFSLDGPEEVHDRTRQVPGLYRRVMEGFDKVRRGHVAAGVASHRHRPLGGRGKRLGRRCLHPPLRPGARRDDGRGARHRRREQLRE